ncbi:MAG TPA: hypothetical protein VN810_02510 [Terriglobales bacterium]|nr:hypothetical protein [Terriglobales bacterium]
MGLLSLVAVLALGFGSVAAPHAKSTAFLSPDKMLVATVIPAGKQEGAEGMESRVEIRRKDGARLRIHDFSSADGEHGFGVDGAEWTADSRFFVFRMRSSGGHSPTYAPVVFWDRTKNGFYQLNDYTADMTFSVTAPDKVSMNAWPDLKPVTIPLHALQDSQLSKLR